MTYEERLEAAARVAALMRTGEVDAMRHVPAGDREAFHRAALRIATRWGVRVKIRTEGETTTAVFFRDGSRP